MDGELGLELWTVPELSSKLGWERQNGVGGQVKGGG